LLEQIFIEAKANGKKFRVIVADAGPDYDGRELATVLS